MVFFSEVIHTNCCRFHANTKKKRCEMIMSNNTQTPNCYFSFASFPPHTHTQKKKTSLRKVRDRSRDALNFKI